MVPLVEGLGRSTRGVWLRRLAVLSSSWGGLPTDCDWEVSEGDDRNDCDGDRDRLGSDDLGCNCGAQLLDGAACRSPRWDVRIGPEPGCRPWGGGK